MDHAHSINPIKAQHSVRDGPRASFDVRGPFCRSPFLCRSCGDLEEGLVEREDA